MRFFRPPFISRFLYRGAIFSTGKNDKSVCLSFDDGPHPATTPVLLEILDRYEIKALFFLTGEAAEKYPYLVKEIKNCGHIIGNHGYKHINGFRSTFTEYIENVDRGAIGTSDKLFRPPYGKITFRQYRYLCKRYKIIMWDLMGYDFDKKLGSGEVIGIITRKSRHGSIIVLHDKPSANATAVLEEAIKALQNRGFSFSLPDFEI